jgi:signal transduction histidine kinase
LIGYVAYSAEEIFESRTRATIAAEVRGLAEQYAEGGIHRLASTVTARARRQTPDSSLYLLTAFSGARIAGNIAAIAPGVMQQEGLHDRITYVPAEGTAERSGEAVAHVFPLEGGFALLVGRDIFDQKAFEAVLQRAAIMAAGLMLVLGIGGGFYIARRVLSRIDTMADASGAIMAGSLSERIPVTGAGDEFDRLAERLNAMLARIEALVQGMREVTDNVAHDLRTPLTRLKSRAEQALRDVERKSGNPDDKQQAHLEGIIEDADGLIRVFNALLAIARTEAGEGAAFAALDLTELVGDVTELYGPLAEDASADLVVDVPDALPVIHGNGPLLTQALANLIDNAIKYGTNPQTMNDTITVSARIEGKAICISVADSGPGIPENKRAHVLGRFVRLDQSRNLPGSGLGLSLVAAVARLHSGALTLADNEPGLSATLQLPLKSAQTKPDKNGPSQTGTISPAP